MRKLASALALVIIGACSEYSAVAPPADIGDGGAPADAATALPDAGGPTLASDGAGMTECKGAACLDFENGIPGDVLRYGEGCEIDALAAHGGSHSLHCAGTKPTFLELPRKLETKEPISFRAFIRGAPPPGDEPRSLGYVGITDSLLDAPTMMVGNPDNGRYGLWWSSSQGGGFFDSQVPDGALSWTCVEAVYSESTVSFFVNGSPVGMPRLDATLGAAPVFRLGLAKHPTNAFAEVYIDDLAIGTERIGCN